MHKLRQEKLLYLVTDSLLCSERPLEEVLELAICGGVNVVQLREKNASKEEFLSIGRSSQEICKHYNIPFIINDHVDIAVALDADGVHIGQTDYSYDFARKELGDEKIIGLSVNNLEQVKKANDLDVDYLGVGPIFHTQTKLDAGRLWKMKELEKIRKISRHVLVGIGGINNSNINDVMKIGFDGVAVVSAICGADDPEESARELLRGINNEKI